VNYPSLAAFSGVVIASCGRRRPARWSPEPPPVDADEDRAGVDADAVEPTAQGENRIEVRVVRHLRHGDQLGAAFLAGLRAGDPHGHPFGDGGDVLDVECATEYKLSRVTTSPLPNADGRPTEREFAEYEPDTRTGRSAGLAARCSCDRLHERAYHGEMNDSASRRLA
jgi:hypothetical protein